MSHGGTSGAGTPGAGEARERAADARGTPRPPPLDVVRHERDGRLRPGGADGLPVLAGHDDADTAFAAGPIETEVGPAAADEKGGTAVAPHEPAPEGPPCLYLDFREPEAYLVAERALRTLPVATPWVPVDGDRLPGGSAWSGLRCAEEQAARREDFERRAAAQGVQPVRWPPAVPFDSRRALLAATYAKQIGRMVSFTLPAFRQAFAGGHDLEQEAFVLLAASACEMHPRAVSQAFTREPVVRALDEATARAAERGVRSTPAVWTGDEVFEGPDCVERAAVRLGGDRPA